MQGLLGRYKYPELHGSTFQALPFVRGLSIAATAFSPKTEGRDRDSSCSLFFRVNAGITCETYTTSPNETPSRSIQNGQQHLTGPATTFVALMSRVDFTKRWPARDDVTGRAFC